MEKRVTIPVHQKTIEPKWYTMIFLIDNTYKKHQGAYFDLDSAVQAAKIYVKGAELKNLWWHFTNTIDEIKSSFKSCKQ